MQRNSACSPARREPTPRPHSIATSASSPSNGSAVCHSWSAGLKWAPREAVSRDAKERARDDEVRTLQPATSTGREGTHCVTPPVVPSASRPDRDEATHEKGSGSDSARELRRNHPRVALTRGHNGNRIGTLVTNRPSYPCAARRRHDECASSPTQWRRAEATAAGSDREAWPAGRRTSAVHAPRSLLQRRAPRHAGRPTGPLAAGDAPRRAGHRRLFDGPMAPALAKTASR